MKSWWAVPPSAAGDATRSVVGGAGWGTKKGFNRPFLSMGINLCVMLGMPRVKWNADKRLTIVLL